MNAPERMQPMGLIYDMPMADYQAVDAVSSTALRLLARSPWHLRNRVETVPTRPMLNGTLAHCALLEPDAMASRYIVVPAEAPRRPTRIQWNAKKPSPESQAAMNWWTDFGKEAGTREIVAAEDYDITRLQLAAVKANPEIARILATGRSEVSVFWIDPATGVYCKARPDHVHRRPDGRAALLDLKSTADESPRAFSRTLASMGYHRQEAHYTAGFKAATGVDVAEFVFAAVSSAPPVLAVDYRTDAETQEQARDEVAELLALYAECQRTGKWPDYEPAEKVIGLPAWARRNNEIEVSYAD